jgi:hypothetical protein
MKPVAYAGIILLFIFLVLACGCTTTSQSGGTTVTTPSLIGNWSGTYKNYVAGEGFGNGTGYSLVMSVTDQQDRIFSGAVYITTPNGTIVTKPFAGAIGPDGKTLTEVQADGYSWGTYTAPDQIELIYAYSGENYDIAIDTLKKAP